MDIDICMCMYIYAGCLNAMRDKADDEYRVGIGGRESWDRAKRNISQRNGHRKSKANGYQCGWVDGRGGGGGGEEAWGRSSPAN